MKKFLTILLIIMFFSSLSLVCASEFNSTSLESVQEEESIITPNTEKLSANEESEKFTSEKRYQLVQQKYDVLLEENKMITEYKTNFKKQVKKRKFSINRKKLKKT